MSYQRRVVILGLFIVANMVLLTGCGGGSDSHPLQSASVSGTLQDQPSVAQALSDFFSPAAVQADVPTMLYLDDSTTPIMVGPDGDFTIADIPDGDHSLYWQANGSTTSFEFPFRIRERRGLDFGTITIANGQISNFTGFNGYHFGFIDEDGDGINDNFSDANGDGICDQNGRYAGYSYMQELGYLDNNHDGVNDRFTDANGDGINDVTGLPYGHGFGYVDANGDGVNDRFIDANGDGIGDLSGMPYSYGLGYVDANGDGINDRFVDSNGDGINDVTGKPYMAMPGWVDLDQDGINDYFTDKNGDGINDQFVDENGDGVNDIVQTSYAHGFGFVDADGDGINDRFVDANGDGINDLGNRMPYRYGYMGYHVDNDGNGIDDASGNAFRQCFGWVDLNGDGVNDVFRDANGDAINDITSVSYNSGIMTGMGGMNQLNNNYQWPHRGRMGHM